ncbi:MAG: TetR/AcrR family transcriptional regulator [Eubacteriaceae bacterium]|jgi:AcrR family transcriptional regulator|nr:TetR/AcrR family transcriptional regulator [Eubacteriaceae bacterium]
MTKKQPEVTAETKQNIMEAYWELYTSDVQGRITVKMITDRAGYNRGTFYAHFLDMEDLHSQIEDELLPSEENFEKLKEATFSKNSQQIIEIFMQVDKSLDQKLSFLLGPRGSLSFQTKLKTTLKKMILKYASLDLQESESIVDYKAEILCSIFYATLCYWYDQGSRLFSKEEMIRLMLNIIFFGLTDSQISDRV